MADSHASPAQNPPLSILIPVYNEGGSILSVLEHLASGVHTPHRVYIVFDFDEDNTVPFARQWQRDHPNLVLLRNRRGPGPANALCTGFDAIPDGAIAVVMGDASDQLANLDRMYNLVASGYGVVVGSRYMRGGRQVGGPWLKSLFSRCAGLSLHYLSGIPTRDVTNSFKMYTKEVLDRLTIESTRGFEVSLEIVAKAFVLGVPITEVPTVWTSRAAGTSRFRMLRWFPHYLRWYFYTLARRNRLWWIRPKGMR